MRMRITHACCYYYRYYYSRPYFTITSVFAPFSVFRFFNTLTCPRRRLFSYVINHINTRRPVLVSSSSRIGSTTTPPPHTVSINAFTLNATRPFTIGFKFRPCRTVDVCVTAGGGENTTCYVIPLSSSSRSDDGILPYSVRRENAPDPRA